jgi:glycosyltransferase involved in cell wall biosynthesis
MLTNGMQALLVPADEPPAIAAALARLACDREFAVQLGLAAHRHVAERFPIERSAGELLSLWNRAVNSARLR